MVPQFNQRTSGILGRSGALSCQKRKEVSEFPWIQHKCTGKLSCKDEFCNQSDVNADLLRMESSDFAANVNNDRATIIELIKSCGKKKEISMIRRIYAAKDCILHDVVIANTLIRSFARCGSIKEAREVFEQLVEPNIVSWSALIAGYVDQGFGQEALSCFREMRKSRMAPDCVTYTCALKACAIVRANEMVEEIYAEVKKQKLLNKNIVLGTTLVNAYAKCGAVKRAQEVFEQLVNPNIVSWNALISGYVEQGFGKEALECFRQLQMNNVTPNSVTYTCTLKACAILKAIETVGEIHIWVRQGALLNKDIVLGSTLVNAYARCGVMNKAREVFEQILEPNTVTWNALITGYAEQGFAREALSCFREMQRKKMTLNSVTYTCALKACAVAGALEIVDEIHTLVRHELLLNKDIVLGSALVSAYARCGAVKEARDVFEKIEERDVVSWNALITGYAEQGFGKEALMCFREMQKSKVMPDLVTYYGTLKACSIVGAVEIVEEVHALLRQQPFLIKDIALGSTLINAYARCGAVKKAWQVFEHLAEQNVVSWTAIISGYADQGFGQEALECFREMQRKKVAPNPVTYTCALKACAIVGSVDIVEEIHAILRQQALLNKDILLGSTLVMAYARCGAIKEAKEVFEQLAERDVVSWNALIEGYLEQGFGEEAISCFKEMQQTKVAPDLMTYLSTLKACAIVGDLEIVEDIHGLVRQDALLSKDIALESTLINAYARCGAMKEAQKVFDQHAKHNVVSWTALIGGYADQGCAEEALGCFRDMQKSKVTPNSVTYTCALKACAIAGAVEIVEEIHGYARQQALLNKDTALGSTLVNAYARCGAIKKAQEVFDQLSVQDVVSWTALIAGYGEQGFCEEAIACFRKMRRNKVIPNSVTYICALKACAIVGAVEMVDEIRTLVAEHALLDGNIALGSTLVNAYARCGAVQEAQEVFEQLVEQDVVSWTALIAGYAKIGCVNEMLELFNRMMSTGIFPTSVTFIVLLHGCSHAALLEEGFRLFSMIGIHGFPWTPEHYTCMVDLFGRAGRFDKAKCFVLEDRSTLLAFLGACQKWVEVDYGKWAFMKLLQLDRKCASAYVCMSNLYTAAGMMKEAEEIERLRVKENAWKRPGHSWWTDASGSVHAFVYADESHPQSTIIYSKLEELRCKLIKEGYCPDFHWVSEPISVNEKERSLCSQSEKLAIACALINSPTGERIRITKNMRVCRDCHATISLIAKIEKCTIQIVDDRSVHIFQNGTCSCQGRNFWD